MCYFTIQHELTNLSKQYNLYIIIIPSWYIKVDREN